MQSYDDFWMLGISAAGAHGRKFFDQLIHANWNNADQPADTYQCAGQRYLGGEPVFVSAPDSSAGVVICQEFDARKKQSCFLIFDAGNVSAGPMARILLEQVLYLGFHATFKPAVAG